VPHFSVLTHCPCTQFAFTMDHMSFRERLRQEFESRRKKNPRYSLRAMAAFLDTDHSTLAQILRGARRVPATRVRGWARKLRISTEEAAAYIAAEHAPDARSAQRQHQLRHWTAEAAALTSEPAHWQILRLCRAPGFQADCRWIASQIGVSVDAVNMALSRLLRLGLLRMDTAGRWKDTTGLPRLTGGDFRRLALARVRKESTEWRTQ
jgi:DNA-binding transcriptional regulator YdaS (Cro superfamily)